MSKVTYVASPTQTVRVPLSPSPDDLYTEGMRRLDLAKSDSAKSKEARSYLLRAARRDHVDAVLECADLALKDRLLFEATSWYQRALNLAKGRCFERSVSGYAHRRLGRIADHSRFFDNALKHFRQGALLGDGWCQYHLGLRLHKGTYVEQDVDAAYNWYRQAVVYGDGADSQAADRLGLASPLLRYAFPTLILCC